jgi:hypothetical protein
MERMTYFNEDFNLRIQDDRDIAQGAPDIRRNLLTTSSVQPVL